MAQATYIGMRLHVSPIPGRQHLTGQITEDLVLPAGSHLHLRKDSEGNYVLQCVSGKLPESKKKLAELQHANSPVSTFRKDDRKPLVPSPF